MPKPFPNEFRDDVVRIARNREPEVTLAQIAKDLGIHVGTLDKWMRPERQGRALASTLLALALAETVRRDCEQVVLDTSDPRNVRLYERHGFHTTTHTDTGDGPPVWTMTATFENSTTRRTSL